MFVLKTFSLHRKCSQCSPNFLRILRALWKWRALKINPNIPPFLSSKSACKSREFFVKVAGRAGKASSYLRKEGLKAFKVVVRAFEVKILAFKVHTFSAIPVRSPSRVQELNFQGKRNGCCYMATSIQHFSAISVLSPLPICSWSAGSPE